METFTLNANPNFCLQTEWRYSEIIERLSSVYCIDQVKERVIGTQEYCLCPQDRDHTSSLTKNEEINSDHKISEINTLHESLEVNSNARETTLEESEEAKVHKPIPKKRKRRTPELNIRENLLKIRTRILNNHVTEFTCSLKKARSKNKTQLLRRSKYTGVSRNNTNWQALVNVNQTKKYIGTFVSELQAARAYDIHSIAIRGEKAPLNFAYTPKEMLERIEYFLEHNSAKVNS